jgi:hypothetical protein
MCAQFPFWDLTISHVCSLEEALELGGPSGQVNSQEGGLMLQQRADVGFFHFSLLIPFRVV